MQYMLLIYNDPALEPAYGTPEFNAMMGGFFAANEKMKEDGVLRGGEGLQGVETATSLRIRSARWKPWMAPSPKPRASGRLLRHRCARS